MPPIIGVKCIPVLAFGLALGIILVSEVLNLKCELGGFSNAAR